MKLRLTQPGYETFTAQMGVTQFVDGISTTDVKPQDAVRIAAQFLCEWEDGTTASVAQSILDHAKATTFSIPVEQNADQAFAKQAADAGILTAQNADRGIEKTYTADDLALIADEHGIKGLRTIAEPLGIKGNSISDLVKAILDKQAKA
jgi:hypothetical protein